MLTRLISDLRPRARLALCALYMCAFMALGATMGRPYARARVEFARNAHLLDEAKSLERTNVELEREARYYDTDAGREELARSMGWVRPGEAPIVFSR